MAGLRVLGLVPGIGPKTAKRVFSELGITTVDEVLVAARDGRFSFAGRWPLPGARPSELEVAS